MSTKNKAANIFKDCIKNGRNYYILYDYYQETNILKEIMTQSHDFFILNITKLDAILNKNPFRNIILDFESISISDLFSNKYDAIDTIANIKDGPKKIIYFFKLPNDDRPETKITIYSIMKNTIESTLELEYNGFVSIDDVPILCFRESHLFDNTSMIEDVCFFPIITGIGDFFITFSYKYELLQKIKSTNSKKIKAQFSNYEDLTSKKSSEMIEICFGKDISHYKSPNEVGYHCWSHFNNDILHDFSQVYGIYDSKQGEHTLQLYSKMVGLDSDMCPYKHSDILASSLRNRLDPIEKNYIDKIISSFKGIS